MIKFIGTFLLTGWMIGCTSSGDTMFTAPVEELTSNIVRDESLLIGSTFSMSIIDEDIYIYDAFDDYYFTQYDTKSKTVTRFCRKGKGPGELTYASPQVTSVKSGGTVGLSVLDMNARKIFFYKKNSLTALPFKEVSLGDGSEDDMVGEAYPLNDSVVLACGGFASGEVCRFYKSGKGQEAYVDIFTKFENHGYLDRAYRDANRFGLSPDKKYIARIAQIGGLIELYKIEDMQLIRQFRKSYFNVICTPDLTISPDSRYGYIDVCIAGEKVYALWDGGTVMRNDPARSKEIHVYDFEGRPKKKILLDRLVHSIAVDDRGTQLYALSPEEKDLLLFQLAMTE